MRHLIAEIFEEATRARSSPAPELTFGLWRLFADTGDRLAYEGVYFERRRRLAALILAAHLDQRADPALDDLLWSVCDERSWVLPAHEPVPVDLFAAETAHTLAEAVALLGDHLDRRVSDRVRAEVDRRALRPLYADPRPMWWESAAHNWAAVCGGAAGMAALALDHEQLPAILARVEAAMSAFLSGFGPDGACLEGGDYWAYGYGYFAYFAEALRERTGRDLLDGTAHLAAYPAAIDFGGGFRPAFADSSGRAVYPAGLLSRLGERLGVPLPEESGEPSFHDDPCYRWAHLSRTLWWAGPAAPRRPAAARVFLPDAGIWVARSPGMSVAVKGGHNDEPHNHLDLGHFVLHADGRTVLDDLGAPEYTRDYFGEGRYTVLHAAAEGHSIPLIDGMGQRAGRPYRAEVVEHADGVIVDLTSAYDAPALERFERRFDWSPPRLVLTDTFAFSCDSALVEELFVSRLRPELRPGEVGWGPVVLTVPAGWTASAEEIAVRDHGGREETVHRVRLAARLASSSHQFVFVHRTEISGAL